MSYDLRNITDEEERGNGTIVFSSRTASDIIYTPHNGQSPNGQSPNGQSTADMLKADKGVEMTDFFRHVFQWPWLGSASNAETYLETNAETYTETPINHRHNHRQSWRSPVETEGYGGFATLPSVSGLMNTPASKSTFSGVGNSTMSPDETTDPNETLISGSYSPNSDYGESVNIIRNRSHKKPSNLISNRSRLTNVTNKSFSNIEDMTIESLEVEDDSVPPQTVVYSTSETSSDEEDAATENGSAGGTSTRVRLARKKTKCSGGDPFARREGRTLTWRNVNMTLKRKGEGTDKNILEDVWGEVPKRETTAIMGGSGAGKTSLLNILSGRVRTKRSLRITSDVRLNNYSVNPTNIKVRKSIAFVAQDDSLHSTTTPREAIRFSAKLRLPRSTTTEEIENLVTQMINELGLVTCADTIVGGPLIKGISGGERKRTSVGVELVVRPTMVFLDEPTSGLDSYSAIQVCQVLKKVANAGASVLFTIHQPSSDIFQSFDHLILLARGRVLYQGSVTDIPTYFADRGHALPPNFNPADWIINVAQQFDVETLTNDGFFEPDNRDDDEPKTPGAGEDFIGRRKKNRQLLRSEKTASLATQTYMLAAREMSHMYRYQLPVLTRMGVTTFLSTLIGTMFWKVGDADKTNMFNLQSHSGGVMICLFFALLGAAQPALVSFPEERPIFLREYTTEHYSVTSYFLSRLLVEALLTGFQVLTMILILYYMMAFKGSILMFYAATYALALAGTATAVWIGALAKGNVKSAQQLVPVILMPQLLFSGFFISPSLMPSALRWIQYICALTYAVKILTLEEFTYCSDNYFEQANCNLLIENMEANPNDKLLYWMLLVSMFLGFRLLALWQLKSSASEFY